VALEEATRRHHLAATEAQDRPHHLADHRTPALAAPTPVLSVLLLRAMTPSAPARNALMAAHLVTALQHPEARQLTAETHLTRLVTAATLLALVLNVLSPAAVRVVALTLPVSKSPPVERPPFRSALSHHSAWPLWLPPLLSHSDQTTINIIGHSAKVRHISPHNHDQH
jgi:hypothetical protein